MPCIGWVLSIFLVQAEYSWRSNVKQKFRGKEMHIRLPEVPLAL